MATASVQVAFLDKLRAQPTGYIPAGGVDFSSVTNETDSPQNRTSKLIDWAVETGSDDDMEAATAAMG